MSILYQCNWYYKALKLILLLFDLLDRPFWRQCSCIGREGSENRQPGQTEYFISMIQWWVNDLIEIQCHHNILTFFGLNTKSGGRGLVALHDLLVAFLVASLAERRLSSSSEISCMKNKNMTLNASILELGFPRPVWASRRSVTNFPMI